MKSSLIISCNEDLWIQNSPIIFHSRYCLKNIIDNNYLNKFNYNIADPYGLDVKSRVIDHNLSLRIYRKLMPLVSKTLNNFHNLNEKEYVDFWQILIGNWFFRLIRQTIYHYKSIELIIENNAPNKVILPENKNYDLSTQETMQISESSIHSEWRDSFVSKIIEINFSEKLNLEYKKIQYKQIQNTFNINNRTFSKFLYKVFFQHLFSFLNKKNSVVIINSYLGFKNETKLNFYLKQFPIFFKENLIKKKYISFDKNLRNNINISNVGFEKIEKTLLQMLPLLFPKCILEGFHYYKKLSFSQNLPIKPSVAFTSSYYDGSEIFKFWVAHNRPKYFIGQHGSGFQNQNFHIGEIEKNFISDHFLLWGNKKFKNEISAFNFRSYGKSYFVKKSASKIKFILRTVGTQVETYDRFAHHYDYLENLKNLLKNKNLKEKKNITIRVSHSVESAGSKDIEYFKKELTNLEIENPLEKNIYKDIKNTKLHIFCYDSTGFYEFLNFDVPSIIYYEPIYDELTNEAKEFYKLLEFNNLLFTSKNKLVEFLNMLNTHDISIWWNSKDIKNAKNVFQERFSKKGTEKSLKYLSDILK